MSLVIIIFRHLFLSFFCILSFSISILLYCCFSLSLSLSPSLPLSLPPSQGVKDVLESFWQRLLQMQEREGICVCVARSGVFASHIPSGAFSNRLGPCLLAGLFPINRISKAVHATVIVKAIRLLSEARENEGRSVSSLP